MSDHIEQRAKAWRQRINDRLKELRVYDLNVRPAEIEQLFDQLADEGFEYVEAGCIGRYAEIAISQYNPPR